MRFDKKAISQWVVHRCERQLGLSLWTDAEQRSATGQELGIPHRQVRPGLPQMAQAGDEWQAQKVADLLTVFGITSVIGTSNPDLVMNSPNDYRAAVYQPIALDAALATAHPGQFIVEAQFNPINPVFESQWNLGWRTSISLDWSEVRPDIIQVGSPAQFTKGLSTRGALVDLTSDRRIPLRVIDAKLSSEPGPGYFAEVTYYSLALAAWLQHNGLDTSYVVAADAALWPGSFEVSYIRQAFVDGRAGPAALDALDEDLELVPTEVFVSEITRLFRDVLPRVAAAATTPDWPTNLAWHVVPSCSGCDYLGQTFPNVQNPGQSSQAHSSHCVPMALAIDHLSRLPFLPRGGTTVLGRLGVSNTANLAFRQDSDSCFDEHHSLRAGRAIIPARARALASSTSLGIVGTNVTTAAIPKWSDLSLYVTADFDPTSAITLAFGLSGVFLPSQFGSGAGTPARRIPTSVYLTTNRDVLAERGELDVFLRAVRGHIDDALRVDPEATVQIYLWDTLTFNHLTRVIGRHLGWLLASGNIATLAWLFPPEDLVANPTTAKTPAVSIVGDAVRAMVATNQPHTYTLLGTAAVYNEGGNFNPAWLDTPPYWTTQFSDQIPGERAFDIWTRRNRPTLPYTALVDYLNRTVRARHSALSTVTRRLRSDLGSFLQRKAPKCRNLTPPQLLTGSSLFGSLLAVHSRLNAAADWQETARLRAAAPHEREARFASIRCQVQLFGQDAASALADLGLLASPNRLVYEISPASTEAKAEVGDFTWAISPETAVGLLERSLYAAVTQNGLDGQPWWQNRPPWVRFFEDALQVTIRALDRYKRLVVVDLAHLSIVRGLARAGLVDLESACILDPVSKDFLTHKIEKAAAAIGNPPKAAVSGADIRSALGVTGRRGPRQSASNAVEDLLWDPVPLEAAQQTRPTAALLATLRAQWQASGESDLNTHQWAAWEHALNRRLTLIWGPPGTGKSRTLGVVLDAAALDAANRGLGTRLLLTAQTYTAIDNVLGPFAQHHSSSIATFRVRSGTSTVPQWPTPGNDVNTDDPGDMNRLSTALKSGGPVIIGATPQQAQKVIEFLTGSAAGPVFDFIVIDEAGQMDVAHALLVLAGVSPNAQLVVAGDPLQLPPIHHLDPPETLTHDVGPIYSFFRDKHGVPEETLLVNYRSNAEIVELARYAGYPAGFVANNPSLRLPTSPPAPAAPTGWPESISWDPAFITLSDPAHSVMCITYPEGVAGQWNRFEADLTVGLSTLIATRLQPHIMNQASGWLWTNGLGVVTPHRAQRALITAGLHETFPGYDAALIDDAVDTVERFQGQERWVILASYAVGDPDVIEDEAEFLQNLNRFNVLATRAKAKVVVIVSDELLNHIANDIEVIRTSRLLKSFADTYCNQTAPLVTTYQDPHRGAVEIPLTVRWRT